LRMPLYMLMEMPYDELLGWFEYFDRRPIGWRDDLRAVPMLRTQGVKEAPEKIFSSLAKVFKKEEPKEEGRISFDELKNSTFFSKMLGATGGDQLEIFKN